MKNLWCMVAALLVMGSVHAGEEGANAKYKITTGKSTGTYFRVGLNMAKVLDGGFVKESKGSVENLERVSSGEYVIGIVQLDALAWFHDKYPAKAANIEVIGPLYKECAYMAVNCNGKIKDEDDIKGGVTVAVDRQGSGTAVTWDYMRQLNTPYKEAAVSFSGGSRALGKMSSSPDAGIDGVLWVTMPDIKKNKNLNTVMKNPNLCMISLDDYSLNNVFKPLGKPIYEFQKVDIERGFFNDTEITTVCVDAVVVAYVGAEEDLLEKVADVVLNYRASLLQ